MGYLGIVNIDGTSHKVGSTLFGTCATEAATAAKVVTCSDFTELPTGVTIHVKFTYSNTAANPTLNINSKGAKAIYRYGTTVPGTTAETSWNAGAVISFTYDGSSFMMNDWVNTNTNTDTNVTQTATNTNANYEVLFSGTADNTTRTEGARKYSNLTFNPSTGTLTTTKVVSANATIGVADIDTANITEDNVGNLIVTGAARFLNTINGSISGNAATASDSAKLNGYASDTAATNNTIARRTANGYIFATYFNQSSGAETPTSSSYIIYANSDGYFRKSTVSNMKTAMSLNNVENKSSATIRGELTSANVTTALGYTPVNKAGDTMSGRIAYNNISMPLSAGKVTSLAAGTTEIFKDGIAISNPATSNDVGWMRVTGTGESDTVLEIATGDDGGGTTAETIVVRQYNTSNAIAHEAKLLDPSGNTSFPGNVTAPKFIGNLQGTADNADKVDGYHVYYDRYVSSTQLAQPTADTIWYVKVSTANWNSNIEVIQIRTGGNNRTGSHVLYTGSQGTKWWGYGQVYSHRGLSGVYKVISNSDDVYLRFDADCTAATIYTSFTPQTLAIVDSPSGANYTEVPTYGGWYGNQITVDHIQTNNYITIQKQTVASSTFADSNPKIVFKNVDGSQNGSLTWCDYDSVQSPASLTLNGNQGGEYFIAPNIKAIGSFYGNLSGTASHSNSLNLIASNEIRFGNRPSSTVDVYFNYQWADGTASAMINKYVFMNGNKTKCPVEASKFVGPLQGNADSATTARKLRDASVRPTTADTITYDGVLRYFLATSSMSTGKPMADGSILSMEWDNNGGYAKQLYLGHQGSTSTRMQVRSQNAGTWGSWLPVGIFTQTTPTTGRIVITDGTDGGIKASDYTIATSVPANAVFTDTNYYHTTGSWSGLTYTATANGGASALEFTIPTGTSATTVAVGNHAHGTLNNDFTVGVANTTEDSGWSMINSSYNGFLLKSIRYNASSPAWGVGNYGSGICFGGGDTKGILSVSYNTPNIKIAGGNGTKPVWWIGLTGTTGTSYNLASFLTSHQTVTDNNPTLSWGTKSKVATIGSTEINVTMPGNPNTDQNVSQSATTTSNWRKIVLSYQSESSAGTAVTASTNVVYVTPNAEVQPSTGTIRSAGHMIATLFGVNSTNGTGGGISLYGGAGNVDNYGIYFRKTTNKGGHGYVTSDWATYFTMSNTNNMGWVFRRNSSGNVASIDTSGQMVLNGSLTIGGNESNTSGVRQVYNATTQSLDFIFV